MTDLALESDLTKEQQHYFNTVKQSSDTLLSLINDILDFSKIDAGKLDINPAPFSIRIEIPKALQSLGFKALLKKIEFICRIQKNVPDLLIGDIYRLQQIITNLAGNAIKFTEKGEVILSVQLQAITNNQATLQLSISDTGIGIPEDKLVSIFEEFTQADGSTTRKYGGTGLGLAITKRLVELMGGSMRIESEIGKGSCFHFSINLPLQNDASFAPFEVDRALEGTPVLIVEDNKASREFMSDTMIQFRMKPLAVSNGEDALIELRKAVTRKIPFPLILLDISLMGKMDGFDVAEAIKSDPELNQTAIIVITMSQKASDREIFSQMGITRYFSKPFTQSDLLDNIQDVLAIGNSHLKEEYHVLETRKPSQELLKDIGILNILLAEDNLINQDVAVSILSKRGHTVTIAADGEEAFELYKKQSFDLILMDVQMPKMNGYEATRKIREEEKHTHNHIPIIGLTANAMKGDKEKCLDAGMDDYVSKPIRINDLMQALTQSLAGSTPIKIKTVKKGENLSIINLDLLIESLDEDPYLIKDILIKFPDQANAILGSLEKAVMQNKTDDILFSAHALKGLCLNVGMQIVCEIAKKIEIFAHGNKINEILKLLPLLKSNVLCY